MTVADIITELSKYPAYAPVIATLASVITDDGRRTMNLCDGDALEVTEVKWEGNHVLLRAGL